MVAAVLAEMVMMHQARLFGVLALLLGACTALPPDRTEALGPVFNEDVKQGYVALAGTTWDAGDWDFIHFNRKAAQATLGSQVWPDRVSSRTMSPAARSAMLEQRARLVDALEAGAREQSPRAAAKAQVAFDCWLGEVDASSQPDRSTGCRQTFMTELANIEARQRDLPDTYTVFFETGSALLSVPARNTLTDTARAWDRLEPRRIDVVGFADATGSAVANQALADQRALSVVDGLLQAGVPAERIDATGRIAAGGTDPAAQDRRVDIALVH
jgi:outer membrane protein OmpA-like peptidoglycan-associated protein